VAHQPPEPVLSIHDLETHFFSRKGAARAVDGVSFDLAPGQVLGILGESGCGKSVTALSVMGLVPSPPGRVVGGRILFHNKNLLDLDIKALRRIRGAGIAMIFQEPMTSLNPVYTIGNQIAEMFRLQKGYGRKQALDAAIDMLDRVQILSPHKRVHEYPHQLSGGMRQRAMIAMAMSCDPEILIADEPTTALDVTVQAQILDLMHQLREEFSTAIQLITHDLGVIVVIMLEATLSFLGVGVPITEPSLGMMISIGKNYIYAGMWWMVLFPGMTLILLVVAINLFSDWLRDEMNPKLALRS
jgi:ABC-type dipeptide/oligopeptide/nickel transport system ATPase component